MNEKPEIRVFFANAKDELPEFLADQVALAQRTLDAAWPAATVRITTGTDDYERNFRYLQLTMGGGWDAWTRRVSQGRNPVTGDPVYHACVCPNERVGKATMDIVQGFLGLGKPVYLCTKGGMRAVTGVVQANMSYKNGWVLITQ